MTEQVITSVITTIATSAITGVMAWFGGQILVFLKAHRVGLAAPGIAPGAAQLHQVHQAAPAAPSTRPSRPPVDVASVLRHVAILQFIANIAGFIIGFMTAFVGASLGARPQALNAMVVGAVILLGTLIEIIFFLIIGLRLVSAVRWRHLNYVALGTALATLFVNAVVAAVLGQQVQLLSSVAGFISAAIVAFTQSYIAMGIGGGLASLIAPRDASRTGATLPQGGYPAAHPYGYGYGAPPSTPQYPMAGPQGAAPVGPYHPAQGYPGQGHIPQQPPQQQQYMQPPAGAYPVGYGAPPAMGPYPPAPGMGGQPPAPQQQYPGAPPPGPYPQQGWGAPQQQSVPIAPRPDAHWPPQPPQPPPGPQQGGGQ